MSTVMIAGGEQEEGVRAIVCDAITLISPTKRNTVASHRVETGTNISDHIFSENTVIDVEGEVSNIYLTEVENNIISYNTVNRDSEAYGIINKIFNERTPITLVSRFEVFESCFITNFVPMDEIDTGDAFRFKLTLEQLRFADLLETEATFTINQNNVSGDKKDNTATKENKGSDTGFSLFGVPLDETSAAGRQFLDQVGERYPLLLELPGAGGG